LVLEGTDPSKATRKLRVTAHQPFLTQLGDRLFCNAFADFKNLGKIAHWRNDFAPSKRFIEAWT
jgi:hypothetical protein